MAETGTKFEQHTKRHRPYRKSIRDESHRLHLEESIQTAMDNLNEYVDQDVDTKLVSGEHEHDKHSIENLHTHAVLCMDALGMLKSIVQFKGLHERSFLFKPNMKQHRNAPIAANLINSLTEILLCFVVTQRKVVNAELVQAIEDAIRIFRNTFVH